MLWSLTPPPGPKLPIDNLRSDQASGATSVVRSLSNATRSSTTSTDGVPLAKPIYAVTGDQSHPPVGFQLIAKPGDGYRNDLRVWSLSGGWEVPSSEIRNPTNNYAERVELPPPIEVPDVIVDTAWQLETAPFSVDATCEYFYQHTDGRDCDAHGRAGSWLPAQPEDVNRARTEIEFSSGWWRRPTSYTLRAPDGFRYYDVRPPPADYRLMSTDEYARYPGAIREPADAVLVWQAHDSSWVPSQATERRTDHIYAYATSCSIRLRSVTPAGEWRLHPPLPSGYEFVPTGERDSKGPNDGHLWSVGGDWAVNPWEAGKVFPLSEHWIRPIICKVENGMTQLKNLRGDPVATGPLPAGHELVTDPNARFKPGDMYWSDMFKRWETPPFKLDQTLQRANVWVRPSSNAKSQAQPQGAAQGEQEKGRFMETYTVLKGATKDALQRNSVRAGLDAITGMAKAKLGDQWPEFFDTDAGQTFLRLGLSLIILSVNDATGKVPAALQNLAKVATNVAMDDGVHTIVDQFLPFLLGTIEQLKSDPNIALITSGEGGGNILDALTNAMSQTPVTVPVEVS